MELFQILCVVAPRYPYFQVPLRTIFLIEMLDGPTVVSLFVKLWIVGEAILDSPADYCLGVDETVSLGYQQAISVARLMLIGCSVIFDGATHCHNLLAGEMRLDKFVGFENLSGILVVVLSAVDQSEVMKSRYDVNHIGVYRRSMLGQFEALLDYHADMAFLMRLVKLGVAGNNLPLNIIDDFRRNRLQFLHIIVFEHKE